MRHPLAFLERYTHTHAHKSGKGSTRVHGFWAMNRDLLLSLGILHWSVGFLEVSFLRSDRPTIPYDIPTLRHGNVYLKIGLVLFDLFGTKNACTQQYSLELHKRYKKQFGLYQALDSCV
jgi:hypothetical protein